MERNTERKVLSFGKGMTNVPSDLMSEDNELEVCDGFIYRDGELKPVQKPVKIGQTSFTIMYVHKMADYKSLIAKVEHSQSIICYKMTDDGIDMESGQTFSIGEPSEITSVGNTLICVTENGIHYLLFKGTKYVDLGTELPKPKVEFSTFATNLTEGSGKVSALDIREFCETSKKTAYYDDSGSLTSVTTSKTSTYWTYKPINDVNKIKAFQTAVQGHVASVIKEEKEKNKFCFPFFVRYALKLHDGSYARISNPILVCPTINRNFKIAPYRLRGEVYEEAVNGQTLDLENVNSSAAIFFIYSIGHSNLCYKASIEGADNWKDIVKEIVVFASDEVRPFDIDGDFEFKEPLEMDGYCYMNQVSGKQKDLGGGILDVPTIDFNKSYKFTYDDYKARSVIMPKHVKSDREIIDELMNKTQFYKLFAIKTDEANGKLEYAPIAKHVVETLTEQEQLKTDDYYGWATMVAKKVYPYNNRLNMTGVKRKPFSGFSDFIPIITGEQPGMSGAIQPFPDAQEYEIYTHIVANSMDAWVKADGYYTALPEMISSWIYYPDPNATEMLIIDKDTGSAAHIKLKVHPRLNGAYCFDKLPFPRITYDGYEDDNARPVVDPNAHETLDSNIYTSVVNNPFLFEASGDNTVGTGSILGIIANTEAISQGQFGQYPLMVFTSEGIYAMSVTNEGMYGSIHPISREVCLENSPLVPTDKLVYFASEKGLMAASGAETAPMSEQLKGRSSMQDGGFTNYLKNCLIAYDYRDSLLRIYSKVYPWQYIYNMKDKTFSVVENGVKAKAMANDYPDNLIQDTDGNVYSLTTKPDIVHDDNTYSGTVTTRALKLGGSIMQKSLRSVKHLMDTSDNGKVKLEVWGSNNAKHWEKLNSLGGKPWAYFKIRYTLTGFQASDSYAGTVIEVQKRREDK